MEVLFYLSILLITIVTEVINNLFNSSFLPVSAHDPVSVQLS